MKNTDIRLKTRTPKMAEHIEVETTDGEWELVSVCGMRSTPQGQMTSIELRFDDGSRIDVNPDDINWRRPPQ